MEISIDWQQIDTVLLDMDGTILDLHFDNYFWGEYLPLAYAEKNQLHIDDSIAHLKPMFEATQGTLNWYCLDYWTEQLQLDIVALKKQIEHKVAFRPKAIEFLQFLNLQKKQVFLATNAHQKALEIKLLNAQFHDYFEELITSHEFGVPKEEQVFWRKLQQRIGFKKERTLFIDDSLAVLQSAQQFGIKHLLGIEQPDSQQPPRPMKPYVAVSCFTEIMANQ